MIEKYCIDLIKISSDGLKLLTYIFISLVFYTTEGCSTLYKNKRCHVYCISCCVYCARLYNMFL